jgi:Helix-turn-helix domain
MSFQAMTWAVAQDCANAGQKLVLLMLANYCNGHTGQCNPSHKRLAAECCMGVSTLKNHLLALADAGKIEIVKKYADGVQLPNQYMLKLGGVGQNLADPRPESGPPPGQNLATNQELKPVIEPERAANASPTPPPPSKSKQAITLKTYLSQCRESGSKPVPEGHSIREWATVAGITDEMLQIAWVKFKEKYTQAEKSANKRYKDWPGHFATAVKDNWFGIWFSGDAGLQWSSKGMTFRSVLDNQNNGEQ